MALSVVSGMRAQIVALLIPVAGSAQEWQQLPDFPGTARDDASSFSIGARIYVGTGMEVGFGLTNDWYCYDASEHQWHSVASLPATPRQHCSTFVLNGRGFLFGGVDDGGYLNELWCYDPAIDQWTQHDPLPGFGRMSCVGFEINGLGYIATGRYGPDTSITNELWSYDPIVQHWAQLSSLPSTRRLLPAAFTLGDHGYVVTGQDSLAQGMNETWRYDPGNDQWTQLSSLPATPRFGGIGLVANGYGIMACGTLSYGTPYLDDVWAYNANNDQWSPLPSFLGGGRKGLSGGYVAGVGFFLGIGSDPVNRFRDWYQYTGWVGVDEAIGTGVPFLRTTIVDEFIQLCIPTEIDGPIRVELVDSKGITAGSFTTHGGVSEFAISHLASGSYVARLRCPSGPMTLRFIIVH